jgi:hypothetical protein
MPADITQQPDPSQGTPPAPDPSQYQAPDPTASQTTPQGAPLPTSGQPQSNPDVQTTSPQVTAQAGQQQPLQQATSDEHAPGNVHPLTDRLLRTARSITDQLVPTPYKTTIDSDPNSPTYGATVRTPQPLSARALSLSLIMEALQGGLAGAGARGPNATGQAAQAGLEQGEKIAAQRQQAQADSDQQAQTDLKTKQQVIMNGIQSRQLFMTMGRQALEDAQKQVEADAPDWQAHQEDPQSILAQGLTKEDAYAQLAKLGYGNAQVLATSAKPRTDPKTGEPLWQIGSKVVPEGTPGAYPAPDFVYALVKPDAKVSPVNDDGTLKAPYQTAGNRGYLSFNATTKLPAGFTMDAKASQAALRGSQTADAVLVDANRVRIAEGLPPLADDSFNSDLASGSDVRNGLNVYNNQLGLGATHAQAMKAVLDSKFSSAAGVINNWYGGKAKTDQYDAHAATLDYDNGVLNGNPIVTRDDAQRAMASSNPKVQAAGKAAFARMDQQDAQTKRLDAQATEGVHVAGEEQLERYKANLAANGSGPDSPAANAQPNAQGVNTTYLATLPASQRAQVQAIGEGRQAPPSRGSKQGIALLDLVNTAYPNYNGANFATYQVAKTKATSGTTGQAIVSANTAIDHLSEMVDNASALATLPGAGFAARKGVFGREAQQTAQNFETAQTAAAEEVNKAIKGGVLGVEEGKKALSDIHSWSPNEAKSKAVSMINLLKDRIDEQQANLDKASVTGVAPFRLMTPKSQKNYDRIMGNTGSQSQGGSQGQSTVPQKGATQVFGGFTYTFDGNHYVKGAPVGQ